MICKSYSKANKIFLKKSHNTRKSSTYFIFFNANNLYRHYIMQYLTDEFIDWINLEKTDPNIYTNDIPKVGF